MQSNSRLRGVVLSILCCSITACSRNTDEQRKIDPNLPAVVNLPASILPSDTAKQPVVLPDWATDNALRAHAMKNFALLEATLVFGDLSTARSNYHPQAELVLADSTVRGAQNIAVALVDFARKRSMSEFKRTTTAIHANWTDSTAIDSGKYQILTKRAGGSALVETGRFVTLWRLHTPPTEWSIVRDELKPDRGARKNVY